MQPAKSGAGRYICQRYWFALLVAKAEVSWGRHTANHDAIGGDDQPSIASTLGVIGLKNHPALSGATALLITMADVPASSLNAASVRFRSSVSIS